MDDEETALTLLAIGRVAGPAEPEPVQLLPDLPFPLAPRQLLAEPIRGEQEREGLEPQDLVVATGFFSD